MCLKLSVTDTGRVGRIGRPLVSCAGDRGFKPWSSQTKDWLAQCQDNVLSGESGHGAGCLVSQWGSTIKCALSQVGTHPDMTLDVART